MTESPIINGSSPLAHSLQIESNTNTNDRVFKVFWPDGLVIYQPSWIIGWTLPGPIACVITTIPKSGALLNHFLDAEFTPKPFILGLCIPANTPTATDLEFEKTQINDPSTIWFTVRMDQSGRIPTISTLWKHERFVSCSSCIFTYYTRPKDRSLQYFSVYPLNLDLGEAIATSMLQRKMKNHHSTKKKRQKKTISPSHHTEEIPVTNKNEIETRSDAWDHVIPKSIESPLWSTKAFDDVSAILARINLCYSTETKIIRSDNRRARHATQLGSTGFTFAYLPGFYNLLAVSYFLLRIIAETCIFLLEYPIPLLSQNAKSLMTCLSQVDLRLQQVLFWPSQYKAWHQTETKLSALAQAQYIGFFNTIWLIANDIILGLALGTFLIENCDVLARYYHDTFMHWSVHNVDNAVIWLMGWPAGLKLNSELTTFLAELFRWLIMNWKGTELTSFTDWRSFREKFEVEVLNKKNSLHGFCNYIESLELVQPYLPSILFYIGTAGRMFGCTMIFALISDLIQVWTLPLTFFYTISAKIYHWQVTVIDSLFHLFRGRKRNVLRNRVDMAEYDLDQLLIGTVIFTLMIFLFPTVGVYYILFSLCRVTVVAAKGILEISMAILNHFPLFALMLRIKDPKRIPHGIRFEQAGPNSHLKTWNRLLHSYRKWQGEMDDLGIHLRAKSSRNHKFRTHDIKHGGISANTSPTQLTPMPLSTMTHSPHVYMYLRSIPIGLPEIFYQYNYLYTKITEYYLSSNFLFSFVTGKHLSPLPRLDYPTMPRRPNNWPQWRKIWETSVNTFVK